MESNNIVIRMYLLYTGDKCAENNSRRTHCLASARVGVAASKGGFFGLTSEAPGEGPSCLLRLLRAPGVCPWAGGRLPPVCLCLHVASPLCPCLPSSVSYKDPVPGFRATPIQEDLISDLHSITSAETLQMSSHCWFQGVRHEHFGGCRRGPISPLQGHTRTPPFMGSGTWPCDLGAHACQWS